MKRSFLLAVLMIHAPLSFAERPAPDPVEARIQSELLAPLAAKERQQSRFSRARLPAQERRARVLDEAPRTDAQGDIFYTFAVDARHGVRPVGDDEGWRLATVKGCVYVTGGIFVQNGERHRPAAFLLGKNLEPVAEHVCRPAAVQTAAR
jgi:hypothetical protein